jgi:hypothetical protein
LKNLGTNLNLTSTFPHVKETGDLLPEMGKGCDVVDRK